MELKTCQGPSIRTAQIGAQRVCHNKWFRKVTVGLRLVTCGGRQV